MAGRQAKPPGLELVAITRRLFYIAADGTSKIRKDEGHFRDMNDADQTRSDKQKGGFCRSGTVRLVVSVLLLVQAVQAR